MRGALDLLGRYYNNSGHIGFLVIDGLDNVPNHLIDDFLSILPLTMPEGLKVIFLCTSKKALGVELGALIGEREEVIITPLSQEKTERYLRKKLDHLNIAEEDISELAVRSEGHPLYLRYLSRFVLGMKDISSLSDWIGGIPVIHGEIEKYYSRLWLQLDASKGEGRGF